LSSDLASGPRLPCDQVRRRRWLYNLAARR